MSDAEFAGVGDADRERCRKAGIPDAKGHVPKWRSARRG